MIDIIRLKIANQVLNSFTNCHIHVKKEKIYVKWLTLSGNVKSYFYRCKRGSHYPVWYQHWGYGGNACCALYQLVRWVQHKPVAGISYWEKMAGPNYQLLDQKYVDLLKQNGWPTQVICVKCNQTIDAGKSYDWYDLPKISGPGHYHNCNLEHNV
jgi:hypothetical protein